MKLGNDLGSKAHVKLMRVFCMNSLTLKRDGIWEQSCRKSTQVQTFFALLCESYSNGLFFGHLSEIWNEPWGGRIKVCISFSRCLEQSWSGTSEVGKAG